MKISPETAEELADRKYLSLSEIDLSLQIVIKRLLWEEIKNRDKENKLKAFMRRKNIEFCQGINLDCRN